VLRRIGVCVAVAADVGEGDVGKSRDCGSGAGEELVSEADAGV
jgi:hypothetical protein